MEHPRANEDEAMAHDHIDDVPPSLQRRPSPHVTASTGTTNACRKRLRYPRASAPTTVLGGSWRPQASAGTAARLSVNGMTMRPKAAGGVPLLPPIRPDDHGKKTLVLDLDETLVHSSFKPVPDYDFIIQVDMGEPDGGGGGGGPTQAAAAAACGNVRRQGADQTAAAGRVRIHDSSDEGNDGNGGGNGNGRGNGHGHGDGDGAEMNRMEQAMEARQDSCRGDHGAMAVTGGGGGKRLSSAAASSSSSSSSAGRGLWGRAMVAYKAGAQAVSVAAQAAQTARTAQTAQVVQTAQTAQTRVGRRRPRQQAVYVMMRPGVREFLREMAPIYELVLFTAGMKQYADAVMERVDVDGLVRHRLYRDACRLHQGGLVKDLGLLGRSLRDVVIVDNSPHSYVLHPSNALPIPSFFHDRDDRHLHDLSPFLSLVAHLHDVTHALLLLH